MKKLAAAVFVLCAAGCAVYAETSAASLMSISQIELSGYIMLAGAAAALIGILFLLISLLVKVRQSAAETDEFEMDGIVPEAAEKAASSEQAEEEDEENGVAEEAEEAEDGDSDAADSAEEALEPENEPENENEEAEEPKAESGEDSGGDDTEEDAAEEETVEPEQPEPERMNVRITMTGINNAEVKIVEFADMATVGRRSENTLMLSDRAVSGMHCRFTYSDGAVWLEDVDSTNGTVLNDEKIKRAEVKDGDIVMLGKNKFRLKIFILNDDKQQ